MRLDFVNALPTYGIDVFLLMHFHNLFFCFLRKRKHASWSFLLRFNYPFSFSLESQRSSISVVLGDGHTASIKEF